MAPAGYSTPLSSCVNSVMLTQMYTERQVCARLCSRSFAIVDQFVPDATCPYLRPSHPCSADMEGHQKPLGNLLRLCLNFVSGISDTLAFESRCLIALQR